jgi:20S proteasome subunit beta 2
MAVLENGYQPDMDEESAMALVVAAIEAGIYHDLGSGSNVDVAIIKKGKVDYHRNLKTDNFKIFSKPGGYAFREERVKVLNEYKHPSGNKGEDEESKMQID